LYPAPQSAALVGGQCSDAKGRLAPNRMMFYSR